ncbi:MAG: saccharopine dehydrogenase C-terminal domain-containing protein, partial [Acidobacteriota bacterium]
IAGEHPAEALTDLLQRRLPLPPTARDLVVLHHEIEARFEGGASPGRERILSTFVHHGEPGGLTAMATTVGLPAALGARMLLDGRLERRGCLSPTDADVYRPVLAALRAEGLGFDETITRL